MDSAGEIAEQLCSKEDRVFPNVNLESIRAPAPDGLHNMGRDAHLGKGSSTASSQGVTSDIRVEVLLQAKSHEWR